MTHAPSSRRRTFGAAFLGLLSGLAAVAAACGDTVDLSPLGADAGTAACPAGASATAPYIAFSCAFADYRTWQSYDLGSVPPTASNEVAGPRTLYLNHPPPHGAAEFPIGTIIIKTIENGTPDQWQLFAMVKRGDSFNFEGAINWEFFELTQDSHYSPAIQWRGAAPPSGSGYGGLGAGGLCNTCHVDASANDYVQGSAIRLSTF